MTNEIQSLAVILTLAVGVGVVAKLVRLPMIFAYLVAGAILAASGLVPEASGGLYRLFSDLGVMLLLFLIGLEINYAALRLVGTTAALVGIGQVVGSGVLGTVIGLLLGFEPLTAGYVGIMVAFASTVVVVKMLSERHQVNSLHGKIVLGILLVQDFAAMVLLVALASLQAGQGIDAQLMLWTAIKGGLVFVVMLWAGRSLIPKVLRHVSQTPELLFIGSIAWMLLVATFAARLGLSIEIGGFLAGLALANSSEELHIANRLRPLRDFFLVLLFISLGSSLAVTNIESIVNQVIALTILVVIVNPLIVIGLLRTFGYHRRTAIVAGLHISQLSEFSLVVAAVGLRLGHLNPTLVSIITVTAILSIGVSSLMMMHAEAIYGFLRQLFHWREELSEGGKRQRFSVIVIGAHRLGHSVLRHLDPKKTLVIDFDPDVIHQVRQRGFETTYGDLTDDEILSGIFAAKPKMVISTSPEVEDNAGLLEAARHRRQQPILIVRAENEPEAKRLYALGADFVLLPHLMSGVTLGQMISRESKSELHRRRKHDLAYLAERR